MTNKERQEFIVGLATLLLDDKRLCVINAVGTPLYAYDLGGIYSTGYSDQHHEVAKIALQWVGIQVTTGGKVVRRQVYAGLTKVA